MSDYLQPDFYRFNQDSLQLVRFILKQALKPSHLLDIGAGSGVIGIELARTLRPSELTLLELQHNFVPYLEHNRDLYLTSETHVEIVTSSLGRWNPARTFDLIVCNPPYYLPGHGQESEDLRRNLSRNFKQDGWPVLIEKLELWLHSKGKAFVVIKNDPGLLKKIEQMMQESQLERNLHFEDHLCILEFYPRD